jgi:hypothetical protein
VKNGQPVADASIGLAQADRGIGHFLGAIDIGIDKEGRFTFLNVAADDDYYIYGLMTSLKDRGAVPVKPLRVGAGGTTVNVGELVLVPGHSSASAIREAVTKPRSRPAAQTGRGGADVCERGSAELSADVRLRRKRPVDIEHGMQDSTARLEPARSLSRG